MQIQPFFDPATSTVTYVLYDRPGGRAAVIDPVLDFDAAAARITTLRLDEVLAFVDSQQLTVDWVLETHVHADHLSGADVLRARTGARVAIGAEVATVQRTFAPLFDAEPAFATDGRQFDRLLADLDTLAVGTLTVQALHVPGHTPADLAYRVGDAIFVGDTLFMPDVGTARADFPGGDARTLYRSIRRLLALPGATRLFVCHDYPPAGRPVRWETTVAEQRAANIHVRDGTSEDAFVRMRSTRDATLGMPRLILPSVQVNMRAGALPPPAPNGTRYLKLPVDTF